MQQCDAITLASSYACAHPCLKKNGLKKVGQRRLCAHHRASKTAVEDRRYGRAKARAVTSVQSLR